MDTLTATYRKLLVAEESLDALEQSLLLVESLVGVKIEADGEELRVVLKGGRGAGNMNGWLTDIATALDLRNRHAAAKARRGTARNRKRESLALQVSIQLSAVPILATRLNPPLADARFSLLLDACLLVFHQAYFALLPELGEGWEVERKAILAAFRLLADQQPRAADRFNVLALTSQALGELDQAAEYFRQVVSATAADSHDFLTVLQSAWSYLIEHERFSEAFDLLVGTMPRVTLANQDELRELMKQTFHLRDRLAQPAH